MLILGCNSKKEPTENKNISIIYANWAGTVALTNVTKVVLEQKLGYNVRLTEATVNDIYPALARGEYDFFMGAWLPKTHERYLYHYDYKIRNVGPNYHGAQTGLAVPDYVPVQSITELNDNIDKFGGKITGIEDGAGVVNNTEEAKRVYQLDFSINTSSTQSMLQQLDDAVKRNEWIVVTGWRPHWMFSRYNLKFLDDPQQIYGTVESINTIARKDLRKSNPQLYKFLRKVNLTHVEMESLIDDINYLPGNPYQAAKNWAEKNNDVVSKWLPDQD
ncbi:MAG: glycine/betaine ABC transporter [Melioribacteraceae bacterium]|nr:MAG: glycine/betaine ABC transporter [Melioribacteraceae bacterium]